MINFLSSLRYSIETKNWYACLFLSLAIPDICSNIQFPRNKNTGERYINWFDKYGDKSYRRKIPGEIHTLLSGKDCYALRCSYFHAGSHVTEDQKAHEIINKFSFSPDGSHLGWFGDVQIGSVDDGKCILHLSVKQFSEDMLNSTYKWLEEHKWDVQIQDGINSMLEINTVNKLYGGNILIR